MEVDMSLLDDDVLIEILSRLPVKSLIRFTCVCKYWLSLITSPEFASKHYTTRFHYVNEYGFDSFMTSFDPSTFSISIFSYENLTFKSNFELRPIVAHEPNNFRNYHSNLIISNFQIEGPSNGLFLLSFKKANEHIFLLWNPATREVFRLPRYNFERWIASFGFDKINNDYKIINFTGTDEKLNVVVLYSLSTNSWKKLEPRFDFGVGTDILPSPTFNNGSMHNWIVCDRLRHKDGILLSFNMTNELFDITPLPNESVTTTYDDKSRYRIKLLRQNNSCDMYPSLYYFNGDNIVNRPLFIHIWNLKEYGPNGYWMKQHCIEFPNALTLSRNITMWKSDTILLLSYRDREVFSSYNFITQEMKTLQIRSQADIIGYTESLVSIAKYVRQQPTLVVKQVDEEVDYQSKFSQVGWMEKLRLKLLLRQRRREANIEDDSSSEDSDENDIFTPYYMKYKLSPDTPYCIHEVNQPPNLCTF